MPKIAALGIDLDEGAPKIVEKCSVLSDFLIANGVLVGFSRTVENFKEGEQIIESAPFSPMNSFYLNKPDWSAFQRTRLDSFLKNNGVEELVIFGFFREACVHATAVDAYKLGYKVTIVKDCTTAGIAYEGNVLERIRRDASARVTTLGEIMTKIPARNKGLGNLGFAERNRVRE